MAGGGLAVSSWFASSCVIQLAVNLFEMDVLKMDTLAIKGLMSGTYTTLKDRKDLKQGENPAPMLYPPERLLKSFALPPHNLNFWFLLEYVLFETSKTILN